MIDTSSRLAPLLTPIHAIATLIAEIYSELVHEHLKRICPENHLHGYETVDGTDLALIEK